MKAKENAIKTALSRISVVQAYLSSPFPIDVFVSMYNSGGINRHLLKDTDPITKETLLRWTEKALTVAEDGANPLVTNPVTNKPKACPFCGGKLIQYDSDFEIVFCSQCEAHIHCDDKARGIEMWNRREPAKNEKVLVVVPGRGRFEDGLAPCPFCGSPAVAEAEDCPFFVECVGCGATGPGISKDNARSAWNRRVEG